MVLKCPRCGGKVAWSMGEWECTECRHRFKTDKRGIVSEREAVPTFMKGPLEEKIESPPRIKQRSTRWLVISIILLIAGLLSGYILGTVSPLAEGPVTKTLFVPTTITITTHMKIETQDNWRQVEKPPNSIAAVRIRDFLLTINSAYYVHELYYYSKGMFFDIKEAKPNHKLCVFNVTLNNVGVKEETFPCLTSKIELKTKSGYYYKGDNRDLEGFPSWCETLSPNEKKPLYLIFELPIEEEPVELLFYSVSLVGTSLDVVLPISEIPIKYIERKEVYSLKIVEVAIDEVLDQHNNYYIMSLEASYTGSKKWPLDLTKIKLLCDSGNEYTTSLYHDAVRTPLKFSELRDGESEIGQVVFKIPKGEKPLKLIYNDEFNDVWIEVSEVPEPSRKISFVYFVETEVKSDYTAILASGSKKTSGYAFYSGETIEVELEVKYSRFLDNPPYITITSIKAESLEIVEIEPGLPLKISDGEEVNIRLKLKVPEEGYNGNLKITLIT